MPRDVHDLTSLLHPVSMVEFFNSHWERKPLLIRRHDPTFYGGLLTTRDLEDLISAADLRYPALRIAKDGTYFAQQAYTADVALGRLTFNGVPDVNRISLEYAKGATVSLPYLHRTWRPLGVLCGRLEENLDYAVHANAYLTPGAVAGYPAHYDTHEVLVLQLAGSKKWLIEAPPLKLPHSSQGFKSEAYAPGQRIMETELLPGDALYLPRGYVHSTTTADCHSAHVTLGINVLTWADLAWELVPSCVQNEEYRKALPPGFASRPELRPAVREQLARLLPAGATDLDALIDRAIAVVQAGRRRIPARFRADVTVITTDSLLQAPLERRYEIAQGKDFLILDFDGRRFVFPGAMGAFLEALRARTRFRLADLTAGLGSEALLTFARALQNIGFLQVQCA